MGLEKLVFAETQFTIKTKHKKHLSRDTLQIHSPGKKSHKSTLRNQHKMGLLSQQRES